MKRSLYPLFLTFKRCPRSSQKHPNGNSNICISKFLDDKLICPLTADNSVALAFCILEIQSNNETFALFLRYDEIPFFSHSYHHHHHHHHHCNRNRNQHRRHFNHDHHHRHRDFHLYHDYEHQITVPITDIFIIIIILIIIIIIIIINNNNNSNILSSLLLSPLERFSIECRKPKPK